MNKTFTIILIFTIIFFGCSSDNNSDSNIFKGDVILNSQEEVNEFGSYHYSRISGSLLIGDSSNNITDLSILNDLKSIENDLSINNCPNLLNLKGLQNITSVGDIILNHNLILENVSLNISGTSGSFYCLKNPSLTSLNIPDLSELDGIFILEDLNANAKINFKSLTKINDDFRFIHNFISNLNGIENLTSILAGITISDNPNLQNIDALENVNSFNLKIQILNNQSLINIDGLIGLTSAELIYVNGNDSIENIDGFLNISGKVNDISIYDNNDLINVNGLSNISSAIGCGIGNNKNLINLNGLSSLVNVSELGIGNNNSLQNINSLTKLTRIDYNLRIENNNSLQNLNGLSNLISVGEVDPKASYIYVLGNSMISDFCGISNLIKNGEFYGDFIIGGNAKNPTKQDILSGNCN